MTKARLRLVALVLAAFSLLVSSCFQIIAFSLSKAALSFGEKGKIVVDLGRVSDDLDNTAYTFLLIGVSSNLDVVAVSKFDKQGNFGGAFPSVRDNALRDLLLSGGDCVVGSVDASAVAGSLSAWFAYRTTVKVNSAAGAFGDVNRVKVKVQRVAGTDGSSGSYTIFAGQYTDADSDMVPDGGETFCSSLIAGSIPFRP